MPLLRQALYTQNINLYLAPTADNRDAWLGLLRTIGVEGRSFVVSSNMCVRDHSDDGNDDNDGHDDTTAEAGSFAVVDDGDVSPYQQDSKRGRRNSAITEDGFEIALPANTSTDSTRQRRRKSVIDENGNEIVLRCDDDGVGTIEVNNIPGNKTNGRARAAKKTAGETKFISRGGSCIVGPFGDVLAGPSWEDDVGIVYADVDFKDCIKGRLDSDAAGSYSR